MKIENMLKTMKNYAEQITKAKSFYLLLAALEIALCFVIIKKVSYTEIDWIAYMQEVKSYLVGERNYENMYGDTGPLVYPAGFVYIFSILYWLTNQGVDILTGQYIFAALYVFSLMIVLALYRSGGLESPKIDSFIALLLVLSKRIHSIYILRMFNDCVAVAFGYSAILLFTKNKWRMGCLIYSLGVSVKMNMLLYAPGVLLVLLVATGLRETFICLSICASVQLVLGYPFLATFPVEYLSRSFDVRRVFMYKWTVNLKFLPEDVFIGKQLSILLLFLTLTGMTLFWFKWIRENMAAMRLESKNKRFRNIISLIGAGCVSVTHSTSECDGRKISGHFIIATIFTSNFIGIVFARTLHYQFYVWYFHTVPYLLWHAEAIPLVGKLLVYCAIEVAFNVYPATAWSSGLLQAAHLVLLGGIFLSPAPLIFEKRVVEGEPALCGTVERKTK